MYTIIKNRKLIPYINYITYNKFWQKYLKNEYFDKNDKEFSIDVRKKFSYLPEYVYEPYLNSFRRVNKIDEIIEKISKNFLKFDNKKFNVVVKKNQMEEWQAFISLCSAVPFVARVYFDNQVSLDSMKSIDSYSILPLSEKFDNKCLDALSNVVDLHIHINGTSETFYSWEQALLNPKKFIDSYTTKKNNSLEQLLNQDNILIEDFFSMLELSKYVRGLLKYILKHNIEDIEIDIYSFKNSIYKNKNLLDDKLSKSGYSDELLMWFNIFSIENISKELESLIHFYLLSQSQFERILVQQTKQNGFRQFLHISDNNVRDGYEDRGFKDRFRQLRHINSTGKVNLEVRVTPKRFSKKLESIINTYKELLEKKEIQESTFQISVVCHFIKLEEESYYKKEKFIDIERYAKTKAFTKDNIVKLLGEVTSLLNKTIDTGDVCRYFVGIDAAGNEMYSSPESFASDFRLFRNRLKEYGKNIGITFHAGEDFVHLISGIRYIYEVIEFIDYEIGDRIGHANALGLDSRHWREKLNNTIFMKRGEWLDNLIFFASKTKTTDEKVLRDIENYWSEVYPSLNSMKIKDILKIGYAAYHIRKYNYKELLNNDFDLKNIIKNEWGFNLDNEDINKVLEIYKMYLYNTYDTYDEYIEVKLEEKFDYYITSLQNMILRELAYKGVIIESMISSNVRICFYDRYKEHHIKKWLDKKHNMPLVTLASDDPGIFNNNIFVEYSHLYEMTDYNKEKFLEYVNLLKNNGEKANFSNIDFNKG